MASAFLHSSRNDYEQQRSTDLTKNFTNNKLNFTRLQHNFTTPLNPNPNPNTSHYYFTANTTTTRDAVWKNRPPPSAGVIAGGFNPSPAPVKSYGYRYITFRLSSYTRREIKELKKRLMSDLERVRALRHWVCSTPVPKKIHHPPPPVRMELLPPVPEASSKGNEQRPKSSVGQKRTKPSPAIRDSKKQCGGRGKNTNVNKSKLVSKKCGPILGKLMKHKHGWVFNNPVDAAALKLYDYHSVITNPMDLGTIKSKLAKNEYDSPLSFASDVRLTFQNAMVYNGKDSSVFVMAERLLLLFEDLFNQTNPQNQTKKLNRSAKVPVSVEKPVAVRLEIPVSSNQMEVIRKPAFLGNPNPNPNRNMNTNGKRRVMTAEEKSELAGSLDKLQFGAEGMDEMMCIIKKGGLGVEHKGDEVELDLEVLDDDTLWDLHSFISSKKGLTANLVSCVQANNCAGSSKAVMMEEEGGKREGGEEYIDIGEEEMGVGNFPFVEIEKDGVNGGGGSSGSSSSDSSSSSSSSDSGSSSSGE